MLLLPTSIEEMDKLIKDGVQEDLHLDYKESPALDKNKRHEIAKDISAFANSDGGILIYGIIEKDNLPIGKDNGVDHTKFSRETFEQIISSNITPRIDSIRIVPIPISTKTSIYVVEIPKSERAPHQAPDKKYYKRFNFQSVGMEDYEINDVRNRRNIVLPLINVDVETKSGFMAYFKVSNVGSLPALNVSFSVPENIRWAKDRQTPTLFKRGTKYFPPQKNYYFLWNTMPILFHSNDETERQVDITATYLNPQTNKYISDTFHIDLENYRDGSRIKSEIVELTDTLKESFKNLTNEIKKLNSNMEKFTILGGNTGLDLSVTTLRNLKSIVSGDGKFEKIDPNYCNAGVFKEVLDIDWDLAIDLEAYFRHSYQEGNVLEDQENISSEIIEKIKKYFKYEK